jgi:type I restriction enzyme, S subunit
MTAWRRVSLAQCSEIVSGATPDTSDPTFWEGDICWATPKDLSELCGAYITDTLRKITRSGLKSCATSLLPPNSVLFSSRAPIGHVAINTVPIATNQGFKSFVPDPKQVDAKFLYYWLRANRPYLESLGNGATFKEVSKAIISRVELNLPPIGEQRRIADVLDKAEGLRAKRRKALAHLDELVRSIFLDWFGHPAMNTLGLATATLGELGKWRSGGTPPRARPEYFGGSIPWFSSGELGPLFAEESHECVSSQALFATSAKAVAKGSIMIGMYDTAALKTSIAAYSCSCNQAVAFALLDDRVVDPIYTYFALTIGREHFRRLQRGVRQKNLNLALIREIRIPLPALSSQRRFAERVRSIREIEGYNKNAMEHCETLFASLQHRAFCDEL